MHVKKLFVVLCTLILFTFSNQHVLSQTFFLRDVIWSSSGDLLVLGHEDMVCIHETESFEPVLAIDGLDTQISAMALDNERGQLITGHLDGTINFWDLEEGTIVETANFYNLSIEDIEISNDGALLAITTRDERRTELWERDTLTVRTQLLEEMSCRFCNGTVANMGFSPDNRYLALQSGDFFQDDLELIAAIWIWDLQSDEEVKILEYPKDPNLGFAYGFRSIDFSTDGKYIVGSEGYGGVLLWNIDTGEYLGRTLVSGEVGNGIGRFSPTDEILASGGNPLQIWRINETENTMTFSSEIINDEELRAIADMEFDTDGIQIATLNFYNQVEIWDAEDLTKITDFEMCGEG